MLQRNFLLGLMLAVASPLAAQSQNISKLSQIFRNIYGPNGLVVDSEDVLPDGSTHSGHFNSGFQSEFTQFNVAMAAQLTALPLPSPASGFTYTFDNSTGTFKRSTQSFGPILGDRAETIGRGKFSLGFNYQQFVFRSIDGVDLARVPAVFTHDDFELGGGRADVVTTNNTIEAGVAQFTAFLTFGITNRLDVSLAVPVVRTRLSVVSDATIRRIGTSENPRIHFFRDPLDPMKYGSDRQYFAEGTASGMGDIIARVKGTAWKRGPHGLALGVDVRIPSGDEKDLLGSGTAGVKPFAAVSFVAGRFSPHVNAAYQWNGNSELAGDVRTGEKADMPDQLLYVAGADVGINETLTLAVDLLGQVVRNSPRLFTRNVTRGSASFPDIGFRIDTFNQLSGAVGIKLNVGRRILANFNLRFRLDDSGLRDRVTPLVGIELGL
jgi:hypothetical protein